MILALVAQALLAMSPQGLPVAKVDVAAVTEILFAETVEFLGEAEAFRESYPGVEFDGQVATVAVDVGDQVGEGDLLLSLRKNRLQLRRAQQLEELKAADYMLQEYEAGNRSEDVAEAEALLQAAQASLEEAEYDLSRAEELLRTKTISAQEHTRTRALHKLAIARVAERAAILQRIKAGPREELIARAQADVRAKQHAVELIEDELVQSDIRAPFAAVILEKLVEQGQFVARGEPTFYLAQINPLRVVANVPQEIVRFLAADQNVDIFLQAGTSAVSAAIETIVPAADPKTRTVPVRILVENPQHRWFPGMLFRVQFPLNKSGQRRMAVDRDAIVTKGGRQVVFAVREGAAVIVPVRTGTTDGPWIAVEGELRIDEQVVTRGNEALIPGQPVAIMNGKDGRE